MTNIHHLPLGMIRDRRLEIENGPIRTNPDGMSLEEMVAEAQRPSIMLESLKLQCPHDFVFIPRSSPAPGPNEKRLDDGAPYWVCTACLERK